MYSEAKFWAQGGIKSHFTNGTSEGVGRRDSFLLGGRVLCVAGRQASPPPPTKCQGRHPDPLIIVTDEIIPSNFQKHPAGGCTALNEASSRYFLRMRIHYRPFSTLNL